MALAVGTANSPSEFVFPTSEEMGHRTNHGRDVPGTPRLHRTSRSNGSSIDACQARSRWLRAAIRDF